MAGCRDAERGSCVDERLAGCTGYTTSSCAGDPACLECDEVIDQCQQACRGGSRWGVSVDREKKKASECKCRCECLLLTEVDSFGRAYHPFQSRICLYVLRKVHHQYMNMVGQCTS